jgi:hypothetical protein
MLGPIEFADERPHFAAALQEIKAAASFVGQLP